MLPAKHAILLTQSTSPPAQSLLVPPLNCTVQQPSASIYTLICVDQLVVVVLVVYLVVTIGLRNAQFGVVGDAMFPIMSCQVGLV